MKPEMHSQEFDNLIDSFNNLNILPSEVSISDDGVLIARVGEKIHILNEISPSTTTNTIGLPDGYQFFDECPERLKISSDAKFIVAACMNEKYAYELKIYSMDRDMWLDGSIPYHNTNFLFWLQPNNEKIEIVSSNISTYEFDESGSPTSQPGQISFYRIEDLSLRKTILVNEETQRLWGLHNTANPFARAFPSLNQQNITVRLSGGWANFSLVDVNIETGQHRQIAESFMIGDSSLAAADTDKGVYIVNKQKGQNYTIWLDTGDSFRQVKDELMSETYFEVCYLKSSLVLGKNDGIFSTGIVAITKEGNLSEISFDKHNKDLQFLVFDKIFELPDSQNKVYFFATDNISGQKCIGEFDLINSSYSISKLGKISASQDFQKVELARVDKNTAVYSFQLGNSSNSPLINIYSFPGQPNYLSGGQIADKCGYSLASVVGAGGVFSPESANSIEGVLALDESYYEVILRSALNRKEPVNLYGASAGANSVMKVFLNAINEGNADMLNSVILTAPWLYPVSSEDYNLNDLKQGYAGSNFMSDAEQIFAYSILTNKLQDIHFVENLKKFKGNVYIAVAKDDTYVNVNKVIELFELLSTHIPDNVHLVLAETGGHYFLANPQFQQMLINKIQPS